MTNTTDRVGNSSMSNAERNAKDTVTGMAGEAGAQIAEAAGQAQKAAQQQMDNLAEAIRSKPMQAAGIAAGHAGR